jgi:hypothetical protein
MKWQITQSRDNHIQHTYIKLNGCHAPVHAEDDVRETLIDTLSAKGHPTHQKWGTRTRWGLRGQDRDHNIYFPERPLDDITKEQDTRRNIPYFLGQGTGGGMGDEVRIVGMLG